MLHKSNHQEDWLRTAKLASPSEADGDEPAQGNGTHIALKGLLSRKKHSPHHHQETHR